MTEFYMNEGEMVDRLGELRAEIKVLADEVKGIEAFLKASGDGRYDGKSYTAKIVTAERKTVDWKSIAEKMKASSYMKEAYSKVKEVCTLKLTAHKKAVA